MKTNRNIMSKNYSAFEDWEDRKLNHEFSINFCKTGRITMHPDNNKEILAAAKKLYES